MAVNMGMSVLVVDDYKTMTRIVRGLLQQLGFSEIDECADGVTALDKIRNGNYGLIMSDWNMQPMDGLELLKRVRADARFKDVKFVMVTAEARVENVVAARKAGVDGYIVKPFNAAVLKQKLSTVLGEFA